MFQAWLALNSRSLTTLPIDGGSPWPPYAWGFSRASQPLSANCLKAAAKPGGVLTWPSCQVQPWMSPTAFKGATSCSANLAACSTMVSSIAASMASQPSSR
ncbi:hypothetical protein D9M73_193630 [compost metagenome]